MDYATLAAELADDPLARGYAAMTDREAADSLNAADRPTRQLVPLWRVKKALVESQEWPAIVAGQQSETPAIAGLCIAIVAYVDDPRFEHLDMNLPSTQAMLAGAVAAGVVTQATATAVDAMANVAISRAAQLGLPAVDESAVGIARGTRPQVQR